MLVIFMNKCLICIAGTRVYHRLLLIYDDGCLMVVEKMVIINVLSK